jgi:hypothetical protein
MRRERGLTNTSSDQDPAQQAAVNVTTTRTQTSDQRQGERRLA